MNDTNTAINKNVSGTQRGSGSAQIDLRFRDLLEAAPDAILEVEQSGLITLLNVAAEKMFGYRREELLGQQVEVLVPAPLRQRHTQDRNLYAKHPSTRPMESGFDLCAVRRMEASSLLRSVSPLYDPIREIVSS